MQTNNTINYSYSVLLLLSKWCGEEKWGLAISLQSDKCKLVSSKELAFQTTTTELFVQNSLDKRLRNYNGYEVYGILELQNALKSVSHFLILLRSQCIYIEDCSDDIQHKDCKLF